MLFRRIIWPLMGLCAAGAVFLWHSNDTSGMASASMLAPSTSKLATPARPAAVRPVPSSRGRAERSLDLSVLRKALASKPNGEAEFERIVAFARFRDSIDAYAQSRPYLSAEQKRAQAQQIIDQLQQHVDQKEILPIEAKEINAFLVQDVELNPDLRAADIQAVKQQWDNYAQQTIGPSPALDPRHQVYEQEGAKIVLDAQGIGDPDQQQAVMEQKLKALRGQLYDTPSIPKSSAPD